MKENFLKIIFPPTFVIFLLFNLSAISLTFIFINKLETHIFAIIMYTISFYTLVITCLRIPNIVKRMKSFLYKHKYTYTYLTDKDFRMKISIYSGLLINFIFAIIKIISGFLYNSTWFFAMALYNVLLSFMRFIVIFRSNKKNDSEQEAMISGLHTYQVCGWLIMILNVTVSIVMFIVIVQKQCIKYHMIVAISMATYTFYCFIVAVINMVKYRKRKNPIYSAVKCIDMVKALVSIFILQATMLTTFNDQTGLINPELLNRITGIVITLAINTIGAMMLASVRKDLKKTKL